MSFRRLGNIIRILQGSETNIRSQHNYHYSIPQIYYDMGAVRVAITIRSFDHEGHAMKSLLNHFSVSYQNRSGQRLTEAELIEALKEANAIIAGTELLNKNVLDNCPHLKVISRVGVGIDSIDISVAKERGITIYTTPESPVQAVAEHTLALIFSILKQISYYSRNIPQGNNTLKQGRLLAGKTVGVIGLGRIGCRVANLLDALGSTIQYYDPYVVKDVLETWSCVGSLHELMRSSDIITLHVPAQDDGTPLLDRTAIMACKNGTIIINTARGSLIDEEALFDALEKGLIAGAGLDVLSHEPPSGPLLNHPLVVITPHVASNTVETRQHMEMEAVNNIIRHFEVKKL